MATSPHKDDLIVIGGAGGFIGGALVRYFRDRGFTRIGAIDQKPLPEWYRRTAGVECLCRDLSEEENGKFLKGEGHPMYPDKERRYIAGSIRHVRQALVSKGHG
jgi:nucleoside-diphosphate-sugar epimerase